PAWMARLKRGEMRFTKTKHLVFALQAVDSRDTAAILVSLLKSGDIKDEQKADVLVLLAGVGGPNELSLVFDQALANEPVRPALITALEQAARERKVKPAGDLMKIEPLLTSKDEATRIAAVRLIGAWKLEQLLSKVADFIHYDAPRPLKQ